MNLPGLIPGFIRSYDAARRTVRVEIPGITDGSDTLPEAEFNYPIGDKTENTEIRILVGDRVWLMFENGDARYPIVMGYRPKQTGNEVGFRRWAHENIETAADQTQKHTAGTTYEVDAGTSITLKVGDSTVVIEDGQVTVTTTQLTEDAPIANFSGDAAVARNLTAGTGASGSFTTPMGQVVTISDGIVTNIF